MIYVLGWLCLLICEENVFNVTDDGNMFTGMLVGPISYNVMG